MRVWPVRRASAAFLDVCATIPFEFWLVEMDTEPAKAPKSAELGVPHVEMLISRATPSFALADSDER